MTHKTTQTTYMTLRQFTDKHTFVTLEGLRWHVYNNKEFNKACVRRLGRKVLLNEVKVLDFIEKNTDNNSE